MRRRLQLTSLSKLLSHDKCPSLRNYTVLPLMLSPERDEQLSQMTDGRVTTFAHDLVPDYLRTKLEPMAENKMLQLEHKAATLTYEAAQVPMTPNRGGGCNSTCIVAETSGNLPEDCLARLGHSEQGPGGVGGGVVVQGKRPAELERRRHPPSSRRHRNGQGPQGTPKIYPPVFGNVLLFVL